MQQYLLLGIALTFNAAANVLIKAGLRSAALVPAGAGPVERFLLNGYLWGGISCFGIALGFYSWTLMKMPLSLAYPLMTTLGFAIVLGASAVLFGERLNGVQYAGLALIVAGVWLASRA
jgi:multidrug transporter EmrE-like cation transporter